MVVVFGEFFLFLAIASYFEKRWEKRKKTKPKGFPFYEAVWTKSKMVVTVYPNSLELFFPSSRVTKEKRVKGKKKAQSRN